MSGGAPWLDKLPDGNAFIQKQMDVSFGSILVLRDNSTLSRSAFPPGEWKSFRFLAEGEKDDVVRSQLRLVFMPILHSGFYNECLIFQGGIFISKSTKCFSRQPPHRF